MNKGERPRSGISVAIDAKENQHQPIGVFDSGVGGLTVLSALRKRLPNESWLYLGDTARLPYGTKSPQTIVRYARQAAKVLVDRGVKMLVVACNTASALALEDLRCAFAPLAVIGVVEPGAKAACGATTKQGSILVIGTESTIHGGAYERAIRRYLPTKPVFGQACPLFVALTEEGWVDGMIVESIIRKYLDHWLRNECIPPVDCMVLGCTHFPVLSMALSAVLGEGMSIVDSAETTAEFVAEELKLRGLENPVSTQKSGPTARFLATDAIRRFADVGSIFLQSRLIDTDVELVDLCTDGSV